MTLRERYENRSDFDLIKVLENQEQFTKECATVVQEIFSTRIVEAAKLKEMALQINQEKVNQILSELDPLNDDINIHKSLFLDEEEVKHIYVQELKQLIESKEGFRFNVWLYALGG